MSSNILKKINIIFFSLIIGLFLALLSGLIARKISTNTSESTVRGYKVEVTQESTKSANSAIDFEKLFAESNAERGEKLVGKCVACHSFNKGGKNKIGPNLWNVLNNKIAVKEGYKYSNSFQKLNQEGATWTTEKMMRFLKSPKSEISGTKMTFIGLKKYQDAADITKYMSYQKDD